MSLSAIRENIEDLWCLDVRDADISAQLKSLVAPVVTWLLQIHCRTSSRNGPKPLNSSSIDHIKDFVGVDGADGIEQAVWSVPLGIKGQLDFVASGAKDFGGVSHPVLVPMELKTGKRHPSALVSHRAQVR